jgi:hypothetical protein
MKAYQTRPRNNSSRDTHGKKYVTPVHEQHDNAPHTGKVGVVADPQQSDGDDVVGHHLPVVFPSRLGVQDEDLMCVKSSLQQVVELDRTWDRDVGVVQPECLEVGKGRGDITMNVLDRKLVSTFR